MFIKGQCWGLHPPIGCFAAYSATTGSQKTPTIGKQLPNRNFWQQKKETSETCIRNENRRKMGLVGVLAGLVAACSRCRVSFLKKPPSSQIRTLDTCSGLVCGVFS
mmetsp:Transcript_1199/g.3088  ORF Transcript_1199/g.3088 Transcript_1199/m.3088 type:complete len:106 (+) Transcript_1199:3394-3711(+)